MENNFEKIFVKENFERMINLVWFEGALLTLFKNNVTNTYHLFDWFDKNKWLVLEVDLNDLNKYVTNKISFRKLYHISSNYGAICTVGENFEWKFEQVLTSNLHDSYFPNEEDMFDRNDCSQFSELIEFLNKNLCEKN